MLGYLDFLFLSFTGRIGRLTFWGALLGLGVLQCIAFGLLILATMDLWQSAGSHVHNPALNDQIVSRFMIPGMIIVGIFLYPAYAIYTKRWHDRDKSGWWSLIGFVPFIGGLWMTIELGFLGGTPGGNSFGVR